MNSLRFLSLPPPIGIDLREGLLTLQGFVPSDNCRVPPTRRYIHILFSLQLALRIMATHSL